MEFTFKQKMKTILVTTDFSESANHAVEYAVRLATELDSKIILLHAYPIPPANYEIGLPPEVLVELKENALLNLEAVKKEWQIQAQISLEMECVAEMGTPGEVIERYVKKHQIDLIVMGIIGDGGKLKEHVIGSHAVYVARHIKTPLLIIPDHVEYKKVQKLALACDFIETENDTTIQTTRQFSSIFNAQLSVLHVDAFGEKENDRKKKSEQFIEKSLQGTPHQIFHLVGDGVGATIQHYLDIHPHDMLMISPKTHSVWHYIMNENVTKSMAFHIKVPLLCIH